MNNVVSALLVVAGEITNEQEVFTRDDPVLRVNTPQQFHIYFQGEQGNQIFAAFLDQCRTDPVFRVALKQQ